MSSLSIAKACGRSSGTTQHEDRTMTASDTILTQSKCVGDRRNGFNGLPDGMALANYPTRSGYDDREHDAWDQNSEALLDDRYKGAVHTTGACTYSTDSPEVLLLPHTTHAVGTGKIPLIMCV